MKKAIIEIEYDKDYLNENHTTLENELNWLYDSKIKIKKIKFCSNVDNVNKK